MAETRTCPGPRYGIDREGEREETLAHVQPSAQPESSRPLRACSPSYPRERAIPLTKGDLGGPGGQPGTRLLGCPDLHPDLQESPPYRGRGSTVTPARG